MRALERKASLAVGTCAAIAAIFYGCTRDRSVVDPGSPSNASALSASQTIAGAPSSAAIKQSHPGEVAAPGTDRASVALARVAWVGDLHTAAVLDLITHRKQWLGSDLSVGPRTCEGMVRLHLKYAPRIKSHAGVTQSSEDDLVFGKELVKQTAARHGIKCEIPSSMNLFPMNARSSAFAQEDEPAWLPYANSLADAVSMTDGSPEAIQAAGLNVLNSASGLAAPDYEFVAGAVSIANSSAQVWQDYTNMYCDATALSCQENAMSLFAGPRWLAIAQADLIGFVSWGLRSGFWGGVAGAIMSSTYEWLVHAM